jgi:phosphate starvation-inducible PhoH-like protein
MVSVTGARDELIRVIEKSFSDCVILVRGNEITLDGPKPSVALIETLISEMLVMLRTGQGLTPESVERSISMLRSDVRPAAGDVRSGRKP